MDGRLGSGGPTPLHLRSAYLQTDIWVAIDDDWLPASAALGRLGPFFVITAWNPGSVPRSEEANRKANEELLRGLREAGRDTHEAVGASTVGDWEEPGFAVVGIGPKEARRLGRDFGQEAVFEVRDDELVVHGCRTRWTRRRPLDEPGSATGADLFAAAREVLGQQIDAPFLRAGFAGWEYEGEPGIPCPACGGSLHLFGANLRSRGGDAYRAMAIVCPSEGVARLPSFHKDQLAALQAWRTFVVAVRDADEIGHEDRTYWAYVIELDDTTGERTGALEWVYVGQTARTPEERFEQHRTGYKASRWVRKHGFRLRPDLYEDQPALRTQDEAMAYEAFLAERLELEGYSVKGGH